MRLPFTTPAPRKGMPDPHLDRAAFAARFRSQFVGPSFGALGPELDRLTEAAWREYHEGNKSPRTRKAGDGYHDPEYDLSLDWIEAKAAIDAAALRHQDPARPPPARSPDRIQLHASASSVCFRETPRRSYAADPAAQHS